MSASSPIHNQVADASSTATQTVKDTTVSNAGAKNATTSPVPTDSVANNASASTPTNNPTNTTTNTAAAATSSTTPVVAASTSASQTASAGATETTTNNTDTDEDTIRNQKLVEEFQYLLEKSQSLFSGLRDLPPTGSHRQWRPYFEKTFEVYTKLWKFQQTHRSILEDKSNYGLKRWEVGEIASKIGQLYYHYYLRTSETNYLYEAYVFYEAIHERQYFKDILEVKNSALMIKKMRYYARFIIVCLLLNKDENVRQLITELEGLIEEYTKSFKPPDAKEWQMVLEEISTFTEAEKKLVPINLDRTPDKIEHRLSSNIAERNIGNSIQKLKLQEAILVGNYQKQIKFSELTLDMYRMLQSLEREPFIAHPKNNHVKPNNDTNDKKELAGKEEYAAKPSTTTSAKIPSAPADKAGGNKRSMNPHKYLLYRPSLSQLLVYISTAFKDTSENSALLLYLSADGFAYTDQTVPGYGGGVVTSQRNKPNTNVDRSAATVTSTNNNAGTGAVSSSATNNAAAATTAGGTTATGTVASAINASSVSLVVSASNNASTAAPSANAANNASTTMAQQSSETVIVPPSVHCLHPADLIPFTRKPLFLIVDSDKSTEFRNMTNVFDQPVMCLMSPLEYPSSVQDKSEIGSLFTLFLHTPLLGFCSVSDIGNLDQEKWDECVRKISAMESAIGDLLLTDANVDKNVKRFMSDDFLYYFIVRFVLCGTFLRYHSSFKDEKSFPSCSPPLPESVYVSSEIVTMLGDLTSIADVGTYFSLPAYATSSSTATSITVAVPTANATTNAGSITNLNNSSSTAIASSSPPSATTTAGAVATPVDNIA